jgi:hypothetical protein
VSQPASPFVLDSESTLQIGKQLTYTNSTPIKPQQAFLLGSDGESVSPARHPSSFKIKMHFLAALSQGRK